MKARMLFAFAIIVFISACGSNPTKPQASAIPTGAKFKIEKFSVNLTETLHYEEYPQQEAVAKILMDDVVDDLSKRQILAKADDANVYLVSIVVDYERHFAGDASPIPSRSVGTPHVGYKIIVTYNGETKMNLEKSNLIVNRGLGGNLVSSFTLGLGRTPKDELKDLETLAIGLVDEIAGKK